VIPGPNLEVLVLVAVVVLGLLVLLAQLTAVLAVLVFLHQLRAQQHLGVVVVVGVRSKLGLAVLAETVAVGQPPQALEQAIQEPQIPAAVGRAFTALLMKVTAVMAVRA
jgi:hypothetical protein